MNSNNQVTISNDVIMELENIYFSYDGVNNVLKNVSFSILANEYLCIVGSNGSGKSTVSKIITGLIKPSSGTLRLFGETIDHKNVKRLRDNIGIIFQNPDNQFIGFTAEDDIAFGLENRKYPRHAIQYTIDVVAQQIGIVDLLKIESHKMSGGQKQLVAIASVIAIKPRIIIFDESTSMLDPISKERVKKLMVALRNSGCSVVSITHDMEEIVNADRVIVFHRGELTKVGTPEDVFNNDAFLKKMRLTFPIAQQFKMLMQDKCPNLSASLDIKKIVKEICQKIS